MRLLRDQLSEVVCGECVSAHMPGHKYRALHQTNWFQIDTTEIEGTDNLHAPSGALKASMAFCATCYGSKHAHYLVNGSTVGLLAAIMGSCASGDKILIGRDCHKSVYSAVSLKGLREVVVMPQHGPSGEMLGYSPQEILGALAADKTIMVAVITSPSYYGYCTPLKEIADMLAARGGLLIVDEAHGAHLQFVGLEALSALNQGAHVVIQSAHKTLPALTQTGMLHFSERLSAHRMHQILSILSMLQSTSPSYLLMASIDEALHWMSQHAIEGHAGFMEALRTFNLRFRGTFINEDSRPQDPYKVWLASEAMGYSGYEVNDFLMHQGIYAELATPQGVLLYLSVLNTAKDFDTITSALEALPKRQGATKLCHPLPMPYPERVVLEQDLFASLSETMVQEVSLEESIGCVALDRIVPYPPGVPLLLPGERITKAHVDYLRSLSRAHVVLGLEGSRDKIRCITSEGL